MKGQRGASLFSLHPIPISVAAVVVVAACGLTAFVWMQQTSTKPPGQTQTVCGSCPTSCLGYALSLSGPLGGAYPSHTSFGQKTWYNYSVSLCREFQASSLFFGVFNETCSPNGTILGISLTDSSSTWNLSASGSSGWWNSSSSGTLPIPNALGELSINSVGGLGDSQLFSWLLTSPENSGVLYHGFLTPPSGSSNGCTPIPP